MEIAIPIIIAVTLLNLALILWASKAYKRRQVSIQDTYADYSDRDLLLLIREQPDKMINTDRLASITGWSKSMARSRLSTLMHNRIVKYHYTASMKYYYEFKEDIDSTLLDLSEKPYIAVEDLINIFEHFDHDVSITKICLATNLPIKEIKREMKYFVKEKILETVYDAYGRTRYLLKEPFRSQYNLLEDLELPEDYKQVKYAHKGQHQSGKE